MNTLDIFFIFIALNCVLFFALCIYSTFLNKKEVKIKTTKYPIEVYSSFDNVRYPESLKNKNKDEV